MAKFGEWPLSAPGLSFSKIDKILQRNAAVIFQEQSRHKVPSPNLLESRCRPTETQNRLKFSHKNQDCHRQDFQTFASQMCSAAGSGMQLRLAQLVHPLLMTIHEVSFQLQTGLTPEILNNVGRNVIPYI
jgi:hypothetical protein